jgi:hypothetical protein
VKCWVTAPMANSRSVPLPGEPSPDHPVRSLGGEVVPSAPFAAGFRDVFRARMWGTLRITNLLRRSSNPSRFSRIRPTLRMSLGFSKFSDKAGMNSATNNGSFGGSDAMNFGSMVKLFSAGWHVPHVRPLPLKVSLKNSSAPFVTSGSKDATTAAGPSSRRRAQASSGPPDSPGWSGWPVRARE